MTQFIKTEEGWINLATIGSITRHAKPKSAGGGSTYLAGPIKGGAAYTLSYGFDPDRDLAPIVPAGYPLHVAVIDVCHTDDKPPTIEDVIVEFHLVLAWRIVHGEAEPVLAENPEPHGATVAIPLGENLWHLPYDRSGVTLESIRQELLEAARNRWKPRSSAA